MIYIKQSTAVNVMLGVFVDDMDGKTTEEALTLSQADLQLSKNCGSAAQKNDATSATHIYGGNYKVPLDATDTGTLGRLDLMCKESGALPLKASFMVVPSHIYDVLVLGTDKLEVDAVQLSNSAQSLLDLKDFVDTGYSPISHNVAGVTLVGTTTTNSDMRGTDSAALAATALSNAGISEPTQGTPPTTPTPEEALKYIYFRMMNKNTETAGEHAVFNAAGTTKVIKASVSDSAGILTKDKFVSGA